MEACIKEDEQALNTLLASPRLSDYKANRIKKLKFLILTNLQYSAILSQLSQHEKSLENAKKTWKYLVEMFQECFEYVKDLKKAYDSALINSQNTKNTPIPKNTNKKQIETNLAPSQKKNSFLNESTESKGSCSYSNIKSPKSSSNIPSGINSMAAIKNEVIFSKIVLDYAWPILDFICSFKSYEEISSKGKEMIGEVRKSLYFWKNNPENNEKHLRKELKLPLEKDEEIKRSLLGVADSTEWLENFNIGAIMHMNSLTYEEFMFYGEIIYEVSKKLLLEKVIYFSVVLFTMATEIRFIELERKKLEKTVFETSEKDSQGGVSLGLLIDLKIS